MRTRLVKLFAAYGFCLLFWIAAAFAALKGSWGAAACLALFGELLVVSYRLDRIEALHTGHEYSAGFIAGVQTCAKEIENEHTRGRVLSLIGGRKA
jgi:hypothetical protein